MEIIFAGASHHGLSGYFSVCEYFSKIYILDESKDEIICAKRKCDEIIHNFDEIECPLVYLCGYGKFITRNQLSKKVYINTHESLLPKYRGMHPIFYSILNGEQKMGVTMHLVNEEMDAGDILAQFEFEYTRQNIIEIKKQIDDIVKQNAGRICYEYVSGMIEPVRQNEKDATYGAKRNFEDCFVDFEAENIFLRNFFDALTEDYPLPRLKIRNDVYEVTEKPILIEKRYFGPIGRIVNKDKTGAWIKVRDGYMIISKVRKIGENQEIMLTDLVPIGYRFEKK